MTLLTGDLTINPGQNVSLTMQDAEGYWGYVTQFNISPTFTNWGHVTIFADTEANQTSGERAVGFALRPNNGLSHFINKAGATFTLTAVGPDSDAFGITTSAASLQVTNEGLIEVSSERNAWGIYSTDTGFDLDNSGTIRVSAPGVVLGVGFNGVINNSGTIEVEGGEATGVSLDHASTVFTNSGLVKATSTGAFVSTGVIFFNATDSTMTITNTATGVVEGDFAFREVQPLASLHFSRQVLENAGTVNGVVDLKLGDDTLHNTGEINGYVALGQGNDTYYGGGALNSSLYAGFGNDTMTGGGLDDFFYGEEGVDVMDGAGGNDVIDGGHDGDSLTGGAGGDFLYGGYGNDTLHGGSENDVLDGWEGADALFGEGGTDTIVISKAAYSSGATFDTISGFEFGVDRFRLTSAPTTVNAAVNGGTLSSGTFGSDLAAAISGGQLSARGALLFSPNAGGYAGSTFLVIDANNQAGYQDSADIVVRLLSSSGSLGLSSFVQGNSTYNPLPLSASTSPVYYIGRELFGDFTIHSDERLDLELDGDSIGLAVINLGFSPAPVTITNAGEVSIHSVGGTPAIDGFIATETTGNYDLTFINAEGASFLLEADAPSGTTNAVGGVVRHFENHGDFAVVSSGDAIGVTIESVTGSSFANSGFFHVAGAKSASGLIIGNGSLQNATFENSGTILVEAGSSAAFAEAVNIAGSTATFINSGTIRITETSSTREGVAINYANYSALHPVQTINNSGLIEGDYAIKEYQYITSDQISREVVNNTGVIHGKVVLGLGNDDINNSGDMVGAVDLGGGNDLYDGRGGTMAGLVSGGAGNDTFFGGASTDEFDGGSNTDLVSYAGAGAGVSINLSTTTLQAVGGGQGSDRVVNVENLTGSNFGDTLVGNDGVNTLLGGGGADTLAGAASADTLRGEDGNDALFGGLGVDDMYGGEGDDLLYLADSDGVLEGGNGYDQVIVLTTNAVYVTIETGVEYVAGNNGADTLSAAGTTTAITIGGAGGDDVLTGGSGNDTLAGMDDSDTINGGGGNDQLFAGAGSDDFFGGVGDDLIYILGNDDIIQGDDGYDQAIILDTAGVSISLEATTEYCAGNNGNDAIDASALSTAVTLGGAGGNDIVRGGSAGDTMSGSAGIDTLYGNGGADIIFGGDDNDTLFGGTGNDQLFGGNGADVCVIEDSSGVDSIAGFTDGVDLFDFSSHTSVTGFGSFSISASGSDAMVDFTGGQLYIIGAAGQIDASDFVFA